VIPEDELAAIAAALAALVPEETNLTCSPQASRWKFAARNPDLEIEEIRALH